MLWSGHTRPFIDIPRGESKVAPNLQMTTPKDTPIPLGLQSADITRWLWRPTSDKFSLNGRRWLTARSCFSFEPLDQRTEELYSDRTTVRYCGAMTNGYAGFPSAHVGRRRPNSFEPFRNSRD